MLGKVGSYWNADNRVIMNLSVANTAIVSFGLMMGVFP
jgi:hypothetical protein